MSSPTSPHGASSTGHGASGGSRGNPAPRRALSRFSPLDAEEGGSSSLAAAPAPVPVPADRGEHAEPSLAAPAGGTRGRDLLIPGPASITARGRNGRPVPSLADLMPPAAPAGRRSSGHGHHGQHGTPTAKGGAASSTTEPTKKGSKDAKSVELVVRLAKPVRKRLKARAAELGLTPQQAAARLIEVWLED
jgi:hypothetical protein